MVTRRAAFRTRVMDGGLVGRASIATYVIYAVIAVIGWLATPRAGFWTNDQGIKYLQVRMIASSPTGSAALRLGYDPDDVAGALPLPRQWVYRDGAEYRLVTAEPFARIVAWFTTPMGEMAVYVVPLVAGLIGVLIWQLAATRALPGSGRYLPIVVLASPWMFYHWVFWEHTLVLIPQALSMLLLLVGWRRASARLIALSALALGPGVVIRYDLLAFGIAAGAALVIVTRRWRLALAYAAGLSIVGGGLVAYNLIVHGHPFGHRFVSYMATSQGRGGIRELWIGGLSGWLLITGVVAVVAFIAFSALRCGRRQQADDPPPGQDSWRALATLVAFAALIGWAIAIRVSLYTRDDPYAALVAHGGLLTVSPILLVGLSPGFLDRRSPQRAILAIGAIGTVVITTLVQAGTHGEASGVHWGPRYLLPALVPLAMLAADRIADAVRMVGANRHADASPMARGAGAARLCLVGMAILVIAGIADTIWSYTLVRDQRTRTMRVERYVAGMPERVLMTDVWWVPQVYARLHATKQIFFVENDRQAAACREYAAASGETAILLATKRPVSSSGERLAVPGAPERGRVVDVGLWRLPLQSGR